MISRDISWLLVLSLAYAATASYFDDSSCITRLPNHEFSLEATDLNEKVSSLKISVSRAEYELSKNEQPLIISISGEELSDVDSVIAQAVINDEKQFKVVGQWSEDESLSTLDCSGHKDTLVGKNVSKKFEWRLNDLSQVDDYASSIVFIATIVKKDKTYVSNIKSEPVKLAKSSVSSKKSVSKRDLTKQFELSTSQCGSKKSCYVSPRTCDIDARTCNFVLSWDYDGQLVNYELIALTAGSWSGVILSKDQTPGDDFMIACEREPGSYQVYVNQYYRRGVNSEFVRVPEPNDKLSLRSGEFHPEGYIQCRFSRPKDSDNEFMADLNSPYFIYVDRGMPNEQISKLNNQFSPSDSKIDFGSNTYVVRNPRSWLIKVHAILGIVAWIFLGSIGITLARYYKPLWPNHVLFGAFRVWFTYHRVMMMFVTILSVLCLLFALFEMDWVWSKDGNELIHAVLGVIVVVCSCINPILGLLRPKPDTCRRCLFFWCHWLFGTIAYCLAVPVIFIGMDLRKSDLPNWCAWLLFAWVIFHLVVEIILVIHYLCTSFRLQGNYNEYNYDYDRNRKNLRRIVKPPGYRWKPTLLFVYSIVTAIVVSCLVIAVILFDI